MPEKPQPPSIRQRNTTGNRYTFAATKDGAAYTVEPGDATEYPVLLHGWTQVDDEPSPADGPRPAAKTPASKTKCANNTEGGEPR